MAKDQGRQSQSGAGNPPRPQVVAFELLPIRVMGWTPASPRGCPLTSPERGLESNLNLSQVPQGHRCHHQCPCTACPFLTCLLGMLCCLVWLMGMGHPRASGSPFPHISTLSHWNMQVLPAHCLRLDSRGPLVTSWQNRNDGDPLPLHSGHFVGEFSGLFISGLAISFG